VRLDEGVTEGEGVDVMKEVDWRVVVGPIMADEMGGRDRDKVVVPVGIFVLNEDAAAEARPTKRYYISVWSIWLIIYLYRITDLHSRWHHPMSSKQKEVRFPHFLQNPIYPLSALDLNHA
jgi:hypothetical protein